MTQSFRDNELESFLLWGFNSFNYLPYGGDTFCDNASYMPNIPGPIQPHFEQTNPGASFVWGPPYAQDPWAWNDNNMSTLSAPTQHHDGLTNCWIRDNASAAEAPNMANRSLMNPDLPEAQDTNHGYLSPQAEESSKETTVRRGQAKQPMRRSRRAIRNTKYVSLIRLTFHFRPLTAGSLGTTTDDAQNATSSASMASDGFHGQDAQYESFLLQMRGSLFPTKTASQRGHGQQPVSRRQRVVRNAK